MSWYTKPRWTCWWPSACARPSSSHDHPKQLLCDWHSSPIFGHPQSLMAMAPLVTGAGLVMLEGSNSRPHIRGGSKTEAGNLFQFVCRNQLNRWQNYSACQPKIVVRGLKFGPLWQRAPQLKGMECGWYGSVCSHMASKAHKRLN